MKTYLSKMPEAAGCTACSRYLDMRQRHLWNKLCAKRKMSECEIVRRYTIHVKHETSRQTAPSTKHEPSRRTAPSSPKLAQRRNAHQRKPQPETTSRATPRPCHADDDSSDDNDSTNSKVKDVPLASVRRKWCFKRQKYINIYGLEDRDCAGLDTSYERKGALDESAGGNGDDEGRPRTCARRGDTLLLKGLLNGKAPGTGGVNMDDLLSSAPKTALHGNITQACGFLDTFEDDMDYYECKKCTPKRRSNSLEKGDKRIRGERVGVKDTEKAKQLREKEEAKKKVNVSAERTGRYVAKLADGDRTSRSRESNSREKNEEVKSEEQTKKKRHRCKVECKTTEETSVERRKRKRTDAPGEEVTKKLVNTIKRSRTVECEEGDPQAEDGDINDSTTSSQSDEDSSSKKKKKKKKKVVTQKEYCFIEDFQDNGDDKCGNKKTDKYDEGQRIKPKVEGAEARKIKEETPSEKKGVRTTTRLEREEREGRERKLRSREKIPNKMWTSIPAPCSKRCGDEWEKECFILFVRKLKRAATKANKKFSDEQFDKFAVRCWRSLCPHRKQAFMNKAARPTTADALTKKPEKC